MPSSITIMIKWNLIKFTQQNEVNRILQKNSVVTIQWDKKKFKFIINAKSLYNILLYSLEWLQSKYYLI